MLPFIRRCLSVGWLLALLLLAGNVAGQTPAAPPPTSLTCLAAAGPARFAALKTAIGNAQMVMLGEQTHEDGTTLEVKVDLIRYLHDSLGFTVLAFEADMYGADKAGRNIRAGQPALSALQACLYNKRIWSGTAEFQPLATYLEARPHLRVTGFDSNLQSEYTEDLALPELRAFLAQDQRTRWREEEFYPAAEMLGELLNGGDFRQLRTHPTDSVQLARWFGKVRKSLAAIAARQPAQVRQAGFWRQWLKSTAAAMEAAKESFRGRKPANDHRDALMADNLLFLARHYHGQKIIVWAASSHIADRYELLSATDSLTQTYFRRMRAQQPASGDDEDTTSLHTMLAGFVPMGQRVKQQLGPKNVYTIGFTAYEGRYGAADKPTSLRPVLTPPLGSLEQAFVARGCGLGFVDLRTSPKTSYYASPLGYLPLRGPWQQLFDGMMFTRTMRPVTPYQEKQEVAPNGPVAEGYKLPGRVRDAKTGAAVPFASIGIRGTTLGTVTNLDGEFALLVPGLHAPDTVQISCIGYASVRLPLARLRRGQQVSIQLVPQANMLGEVVVKAPLSAEALLGKVRAHLATNYPQQPHGMQFFYRYQDQRADSVLLKEEAAVDFYDSEGYRRGSWERMTDHKFLQVRQLRRQAAPAFESRPFSYIQMIWGHDPILSTRNLLSEGPATHYRLTHQGQTEYNGRPVYELAFACDKPNTFTTPYGYPSPATFRGTLHIDAENFAVVRYEAFTTWEPTNISKGKVLRRLGFEEPVEQHRQAHEVYQYEEAKGLYFLKYSRIRYTSDFLLPAPQAPRRFEEAYEMLTTGVELKNPRVLQSTLLNVSSDVPYREEFWNTYQVLLPEAAGGPPPQLTPATPANRR